MAVPTTTLAGPRSVDLGDPDKVIDSHPIWTELRGPVNKNCNVVERAFNHLKNWRGLATRHDKHALTY